MQLNQWIRIESDENVKELIQEFIDELPKEDVALYQVHVQTLGDSRIHTDAVNRAVSNVFANFRDTIAIKFTKKSLVEIADGVVKRFCKLDPYYTTDNIISNVLDTLNERYCLKSPDQMVCSPSVVTRLRLFERVFHYIQMQAHTTGDEQNMEYILDLICRWSYAHRSGEGLTDGERKRRIESIEQEMEDVV